MRKWIVIGGVIVLAGVLGAFFLLHNDIPRDYPKGLQHIESAPEVDATKKRVPEGHPTDITPELMRKAYGATITNPRTQIALLEELMGSLMELYPNDWQQRLAALVEEAFPDQAKDILKRLMGLQRYNKWLSQENPNLFRMSRRERSRVLQEKRREVFGSDAEVIWAGDLAKDKIDDVLDQIDRDDQASIYEKLDLYSKSLQDINNDKAGASLGMGSFELISEFLEVGSVQRDLAAMKPKERAQGLRQIRASLGLDDDAQSRLEALDTERDGRWKAGAEYMRERTELVKTFTGTAREQKIIALRERYFGPQSENIAKEEEAGFFRFTRKRIYGMN